MKRKANSIVVLVFGVVAFIANMAGPAIADEYQWIGSGGDLDWFNGENWSPALVPGDGDFVMISESSIVAEAPVVLDDGAQVMCVRSDLVFTDLVLGKNGQCSLMADIAAGLSTRNCILGEFAGSHTEVAVFKGWGYSTPCGEGLSSESQLTVGASGYACLNVENSSVRASSLVVGLFNGASGHMSVYDQVTVSDDLTVGAYGYGILSADSLVCRSLMLGIDNWGEMEVDQAAVDDIMVLGYSGGAGFTAGTLTSGPTILGTRMDDQMLPGHGRLTVHEWNCEGDVYVGEAGEGRVYVEAGGQVQTGDCYLGLEPDSKGEVELLESDALWRCSNMYVGVQGEGLLRVNDDSEIIVDGGLYLAKEAGSKGRCTLEGRVAAAGFYLGGEFTGPSDGNDDDWWAENGAILHFDDAAAEIEVTTEFCIGPAGSIEADGSARVILNGAAFRNHSTLANRLEALADMEIIARSPDGAMVAIEAGSVDDGRLPGREPRPGSFGLLRLESGAAVCLTDDVDNGGAGSSADAVYVDHLVLSADSSLDLAGLNLYCRTLTDEGGSVTGGAVTILTYGGDANSDGVVDMIDFIILKENFGRLGTWETGDFDADGDVDLDDFATLKNNFGRSTTW